MSLLEKSSSIELSRRSQPFYAKKSSYNLGEQVQIEIDVQREYIDFENSRLVGQLCFTSGTPTGVSNSTQINGWGFGGLIKNLRAKTMAGQQIGHDVREYRAWYRMYKELASNSDLNESYNRIMENSEKTTDLAAGFTDATNFQVQFAHRFMSHVYSIKEYYPAHFHQGLMIEFDLPSATSEIFNINHADATQLPTAASTSIENLKYVADLVQLKPEIENEMVKLMEEQRLFADYMEVLTQQNSLNASMGLAAYDLVGIDGRVKSIWQYTILGATQTGFGASNAGDFLGTRGKNNLDTYRFKLGANYLNYESIGCQESATSIKRAEQIYELTKSLDLHSDKKMYRQAGDSGLGSSDGSVGNDILSTKNFVVGIKVDKAQEDVNRTISSMIDKDRNNIRVELCYGASPGANATAYTHVLLDKRIQILPGSIVRNVRA